MKARELMTADPAVVTPDEPVARAAQIMRDENVGAVPVVEDRASMRLRGLITDRDIAVRHVAESHAPDCRVSDELTAGPLKTVAPDADAGEVLELMKREKVRRVPVVQGDRLVGIIAQADVAQEQDPAVVGNVVGRISEPGSGNDEPGRRNEEPGRGGRPKR
jgi:CBS domain-containing protein